MKRLIVFAGILFLALSMTSLALASPMGAISTDRFGYTGVVKRYDTLADAQTGQNQVGDDIAIGNRDLSLYIVNDYADYSADYNIIMGSWWYSTEGSAGWGNTRGNSGRGFVQLYDADGSTDTSVDMAFTNFDGTHWTDFQLELTGENADYANDYSRFWVDYQGGDADMVFYHEYSLSLTASGLEGVDNGSGLIEASNHPTSVSGAYSGIFQNVSTDYSANNGFYSFDLVLDMDNWAWANRADLNPDAFSDSYFAAVSGTEPVPEPTTFALFAAGLLGLGVFRKYRK